MKLLKHQFILKIIYLIIIFNIIFINNIILTAPVVFNIDPNISIAKKNNKIYEFLKNTVIIYEEGEYKNKSNDYFSSIYNIKYGNTDFLIKNYFLKYFPGIRINNGHIEDLYKNFNDIEDFKFSGNEFDASYNKKKFESNILSKINEITFSVIFKKYLTEDYDFETKGFTLSFDLLLYYLKWDSLKEI